MQHIFAKLVHEMEHGHDVMLVTVLPQQGQAPQQTGAQMLIGKNGVILGDLGGRETEQLKEYAQRLLEEKHSELFPQADFSVLLHYVSAQDAAWRELGEALTKRIKAGQSGQLLLCTDGGVPALMDENDNLLAGRQAPANGEAKDWFSMPLPLGPRVIIFGGGNFGQALVPVLKMVGFRVTVFDDRPEFAVSERFPLAERTICGDYEKIADFLSFTGEDYVIIMTPGHQHDLIVAQQVLGSAQAYTGIMGSPHKVPAFQQTLREAGIAEEQVQGLHMPIGISIGSVTPEEIAISIAAELISVRGERRKENH